MKISAKVDYACRALVELSLQWPSNIPLQINVIAERQSIPLNFLTHILINLKQFGYVDSVRGKSGGYFLKKPPQEIVLKDVLVEMEGLKLSSSVTAPDQENAVLDKIWQELDELILTQLTKINFSNICDRIHRENKTLMFEI